MYTQFSHPVYSIVPLAEGNNFDSSTTSFMASLEGVIQASLTLDNVYIGLLFSFSHYQKNILSKEKCRKRQAEGAFFVT
jgi:hypothetical protein